MAQIYPNRHGEMRPWYTDYQHYQQ